MTVLLSRCITMGLIAESQWTMVETQIQALISRAPIIKLVSYHQEIEILRKVANA